MSGYHISKNFEILTDDNPNKKVIGRARANNLALAKYLNIGYYLITPLLLGVFFGLYIDKALKSDGKVLIISILIGFISTIFNLYKLVKDSY